MAFNCFSEWGLILFCSPALGIQGLFAPAKLTRGEVWRPEGWFPGGDRWQFTQLLWGTWERSRMLSRNGRRESEGCSSREQPKVHTTVRLLSRLLCSLRYLQTVPLYLFFLHSPKLPTQSCSTEAALLVFIRLVIKAWYFFDFWKFKGFWTQLITFINHLNLTKFSL